MQFPKPAVGAPASRHRSVEELLGQFKELPPAPKSVGKLGRIVSRPSLEMRVVLPEAEITKAGGVAGDRWGVRQKPARQVSMIRQDVIDLCSDGHSPESSGDNLHVTIDMSLENLPAGTRLQIGDVVLKVRATKHEPCSKFEVRFGRGAFELTSTKFGPEELRGQRLRGIMLNVVKEGVVRLGDAVTVLSRPT